MSIRALIVDDESLARQGIRDLLDDHPDVVIAGECDGGVTAIEAIERLRPDVLFLDIQMPEVGGFEVLEAVGASAVPAVIFVTAHDAYALDAFRVHAIDYLLKPVDPHRFALALERAGALLRAPDGALARRLTDLLNRVADRPARDLSRLFVRADGRSLFLPARDIDRLEADGNYVRIRVGGRAIEVRETLTSIERQLDPRRFVRIHRSTIVNIDRIREIQPLFKGDHVVILTDGTQLPLTRKYRELLEARLGKRV